MAPNVVPDKASVYYFLRGAFRYHDWRIPRCGRRILDCSYGPSIDPMRTTRSPTPHMASHSLIWFIYRDEGNALFSENHGFNGLRFAEGPRRYSRIQ